MNLKAKFQKRKTHLFLIGIVVGFVILFGGIGVANADNFPVKGVISVKKDGTGDFKRIETALQFSQEEDIIEIQDSETYFESLNLKLYPKRTIRAKNNESPTVYGSISMGNYTVVDGLKITFPMISSQSTIIATHTKGWTLKNSEIYDIPFNAYAIYMASTEDGIITNNIIHGGKGQALRITSNYDRGNILITNNLIYDIKVFKIDSSAFSIIMESNTFYNTSVVLESTTSIFKNNIVVASSFTNTGSTVYNLFYQSANMNDNGNIVTDPLFVDPINNDFHLKSTAGRWNRTFWVSDSEDSPAIDVGDPVNDYSNEPNGNRINLGVYGNTYYASKVSGMVNNAPPSPQITIFPFSPTINNALTCNIISQDPDPDKDSLTYIYKWYKNERLQEWLNTNTVSSLEVEEGDLWRCEVIANDGYLNSILNSTEVRIEGNISRPDYVSLKTQYTWIQELIDNLPAEGGIVELPEGNYKTATIYIDRDNVSLIGKGIDNTALRSYANKGFIIKVGNNLKNISNITIKDFTIGEEVFNRSVETIRFFNVSSSLLENISVENAGGVYLDRSNDITINKSFFTNTASGVFTFKSSGTTISYVKFTNTGYWWAIDFQGEKNGTVHHSEFYSNDGGIKLYSGALNSIIRDNIFDSSNFYGSITVTGASNSIIERNIVRNDISASKGGYSAFYIGYPYGNNNVIIKNNIIYSNKGPGIKFEPNIYQYADTVYLTSNIIFSNEGDGIWLKPDNAYNVIAKNNIIANNGGYGLNKESASLTSSYNDIYNNTLGSYNGITAGIGDIFVDPLFADPINNDFHLKSTAGRWNGTTWVNDSEDSPAIDTGDFVDAYSLEPAFNGNRINMGVYGNTIEASKTQKEIISGPPIITFYNSTGGNFVNKDNEQDIMYLAQENDIIIFNTTISGSEPITYEWQVNKIIDEFSITDTFTWTVPNEKNVWEIHFKATNIEGEIHKEWVVSTLSINEAPAFFESFSDFKWKDRIDKDPWGRALPEWKFAASWMTEDKIDVSQGYIGASIEGKTLRLMTTGPSSVVNYGTWEVDFLEQYSSEIIEGGGGLAINFNRDPGRIQMYDKKIYNGLDSAGHAYFGLNPLGNPYSSMNKNQIDWGPSMWWPEQDSWYDMKIVRGFDNFVYRFFDDNFMLEDFGYVPGSFEKSTVYMVIGNWPNTRPYFDNIKISENKFFYPEQKVTYGTYPRAWDLNVRPREPWDVKEGLLIQGKDLTLEKIDILINDNTKFEYDSITRIAIAHTNLSLRGGSELTINNETLLMDSKLGEELEIRVQNGSILRILDSKIGTTGDTPYYWTFTSAVNEESFKDSLAIFHHNFHGWFIAKNSTFENSGHLFFDAPDKLVLENVKFININEVDRGYYYKSATFWRERNVILEGEKSLWFFNGMPFEEFTVKGIEINGKDTPSVLTIVGFIADEETTIFDSVLEEVRVKKGVSYERHAGPSEVIGGFPRYLEGRASLVNSKFDKISIETDLASLTTRYYLDILVVDKNNNPVEGVKVSILNEIDNENYYARNLEKYTESVSYYVEAGKIAEDVWNGKYNYNKWIYGRRIDSTLTTIDGHTSLPLSESNTLIIADYVKDYTSQTNFTYTITAEKDGKIAILTGIDPDETWYREDPNIPTKKITIVLSTDAVILGDLNNDGKINSLDYSLLVAKWFQTTNITSQDFNNDNRVDTKDLGIMMSNWRE